MAGVAGLPSDSEINGCDTKNGPENPSESLVNPRDCRTSRKRPASPEVCGLIAIRARVGADTTIGQRCSTAGEQIKNYPGQTPFQQDMLQRLIRESHDELSRLSRQRE